MWISFQVLRWKFKLVPWLFIKLISPWRPKIKKKQRDPKWNHKTEQPLCHSPLKMARKTHSRLSINRPINLAARNALLINFVYSRKCQRIDNEVRSRLKKKIRTSLDDQEHSSGFCFAFQKSELWNFKLKKHQNNSLVYHKSLSNFDIHPCLPWKFTKLVYFFPDVTKAQESTKCVNTKWNVICNMKTSREKYLFSFGAVCVRLLWGEWGGLLWILWS